MAERNEELARLQSQIAEREDALTLRERVTDIFKKYDFTVTAIVLVAGIMIGAVVGAITNSLKVLGKGLGNGLKESSVLAMVETEVQTWIHTEFSLYEAWSYLLFVWLKFRSSGRELILWIPPISNRIRLVVKYMWKR